MILLDWLFDIADVVKAYKGLLKEKEALEASVNALTAAAPAPSSDVSDVEDGRGKDGEVGEAEETRTETPGAQVCSTRSSQHGHLFSISS